VIERGRPHEIASAFTLGREEIIPEMFYEVVWTVRERFPDRLSKLVYYLERHINVDADRHTPLAMRMNVHLSGTDEYKWEEAIAAARDAVRARIEFWSGIERATRRIALGNRSVERGNSMNCSTDIKQRRVTFEIDKAIDEEAVLAAAHAFAGRAEVWTTDGGVELEAQEGSGLDAAGLESLAEEFNEELVAQELRRRIAASNRSVREYLITQALLAAANEQGQHGPTRNWAT